MTQKKRQRVVIPMDPAACLAEIAWQRSDVFARCKLLPSCANEFGVDWRYRVADEDRVHKCPGRCLCEENAQHELSVSAPLQCLDTTSQEPR